MYPLLHVGVHELPLAMLAVHGVRDPFDSAADASQDEEEGVTVVAGVGKTVGCG